MGRKTLGRIFTIVQRGAILLLIWGLAGVVVVKAVRSWSMHQQLVRDVAQLNRQYDTQLNEYSQLLVEGEKLKGDDQYKVDLLKKRFGYTRPNETPIVIIREGEQDAGASSSQTAVPDAGTQ